MKISALLLTPCQAKTASTTKWTSPPHISHLLQRFSCSLCCSGEVLTQGHRCWVKDPGEQTMVLVDHKPKISKDQKSPGEHLYYLYESYEHTIGGSVDPGIGFEDAQLSHKGLRVHRTYNRRPNTRARSKEAPAPGAPLS